MTQLLTGRDGPNRFGGWDERLGRPNSSVTGFGYRCPSQLSQPLIVEVVALYRVGTLEKGGIRLGRWDGDPDRRRENAPSQPPSQPRPNLGPSQPTDDSYTDFQVHFEDFAKCCRDRLCSVGTLLKRAAGGTERTWELQS